MINNIEQQVGGTEKTFVAGFGPLLVEKTVAGDGITISENIAGPGKTAIGLARLGVNVSIVGVLGNDQYGRYLQNTLKKNGVATSHLTIVEDSPTPVAVVVIPMSGERRFEGFKPGLLPLSKEIVLPKTDILFFNSFSQVEPESRAATQNVINQAREKKAYICYSPEFKKIYWESQDDARETILQTINKVNAVNLNEEDLEFITGQNDLQAGAKDLYTENLDALFITGKKGIYYKTKKREDLRQGFLVGDAIDLTCSDDAITAGIILSLVKLEELPDSGLPFSEMGEPQLHYGLDRAMKIASIIAMKKEALVKMRKDTIEGFPTLEELEEYTWERMLGTTPLKKV